MKELIIEKNEDGRRLDKFLDKYLKGASKSFIYKMLRKKNIVLNGKKATGSEIINAGDKVALYFSDETLKKFTEDKQEQKISPVKLDIIYEDDDVIFINKPAGMLSQKAKESDISLCEYLVEYIKNSDKQTIRSFKPSVCNRLDRNVSGLITAGKSVGGLQKLSKAFKERTLYKYYLAIVSGRFERPVSFEGYINKDNESNIASISSEKTEDADYIQTDFYPIDFNDEYSLVKVKLITGKTHQIRASLSYLGHPILGDRKYGYSGIKAGRPMLHSYELIYNKKTFTAEIPSDFKACLDFARLKL